MKTGIYHARCVICFGSVIMAFLLAGCDDNREIRSAKNKADELAKKVDYLNVRIAAVEGACQQLHARLITLENRAGGALLEVTGKPAEQKSEPAADFPVSSGQTKKSIAENELRSSASLTQSEIRLRLKGMTPQQVKEAFGNPGKVKEDSVTLNWDYANIAFQLADGTPAASAMLVVFENGAATQIIFHENVEYKTKSKMQEPETATTNSEAAAPQL